MALPIIISHMGENVGLISSMVSDGSFKPGDNYYAHLFKNKEEYTAQFIELLKGLKFRYLCAVTNAIQNYHRELLVAQGFRKVADFNSSHGYGEICTLFTKTQKEITELPEQKISLPMANCTIDYNRKNTGKVFILTVKKADESDADLKGNHFKRVKNTPIFFKIRDGEEIKKK